MTTEDNVRIIIDGIYYSLPIKKFATNKTTLKSIDYTWSSDLLEMNDYGSVNKKSYRYKIVVIDNFSKNGWIVLLTNKFAQITTDAFTQSIKTSKRKVNLLETDDGTEYVNKIFNEFLKQYGKKVLKVFFKKTSICGAI